MGNVFHKHEKTAPIKGQITMCLFHRPDALHSVPEVERFKLRKGALTLMAYFHRMVHFGPTPSSLSSVVRVWYSPVTCRVSTATSTLIGQ